MIIGAIVSSQSVNFVFFLSAYANIIYEFLFELYVFTALFAFRLNRRRYFLFRFLAGFAVMLVVGYGAMAAYHFIGMTVPGRVLIYFLLFICVIAHCRICFAESMWVTLFSCDMAYAAQNLVYKLYLTIWCLALNYGIFPAGYPTYVFKIFYYTFFALCAVGVYFIFARRTYKFLLHRKQDYRTIVVSLAILAITVILCSIEDVSFASLSSGTENKFDNALYYHIRQAGNLFSIACCTVVLLYLSGLLEKRDLQEEIDRMQYNLKQMEQQYNISKDTIEQINVKCHDMRHKVKSLIAGNDASDDLDKDLAEAIRIYDANIRTGNKILDVILTEKSLYCEKNDINLSCMVDGEKLSFMREADLYCLFGNIIDNAIEAVKAIDDMDKRVISLTAKARGDMLIVQEENYYTGKLVFDDGLPVTTKADKVYHGYGMKSIRMIARAYGGEMTARADGCKFSLSVLLDCGATRDRVK